MGRFEDDHWDLVQTLAWIRWRDPARLGSDQNAGSPICDDKSRPSIFEETVWFKWLGSDQDDDTDIVCAPAETVLLKALRSDKIDAWGLANDMGDFRKTSAIDWVDLEFWFRRPWGAYAGPMPDRRGSTAWTKLRFLRAEVLALWPLDKTSGPRHIGRPLGSGSLAALDEPLINKMHQMLEAGETLSRHAAAQEVAAKAAGHGTFESKVRRLIRRYGKSVGQ